MWQEGSLKVYNSIFHYWMKVYEEPSMFGIEGGKVSKRDGKVVCNYDRGWDVKPTDPDTQLALEILLHSNNY